MTESVSKRVLDKLDNIDKNINEMKLQINSIETKLQGHDKLDESKAVNIEEKFKGHDKRITSLETNQRWVVLAVLGVIVNAVMQLILH